jgi:ATP-dependent protease ClpP protease subunit
MSAEDAKKYGIIDRVIDSRKVADSIKKAA